MRFNSNSLFHYTNSIEILLSILESGFKCSYSKETIWSNGVVREFAVPIVSFCDIPLARVSDHVKKYGSYAIGISKDFAIANKFSKVLYLEQYSTATEGIFNIIDYGIRHFKEIDEKADYALLNDGILSLMQVIKNNEGPLIRNGKSQGIYPFFEEMEWRYTPIVYANHKQVFSDITELDVKYKGKPHLPDVALPICLGDINWIIVKENAEIPNLINRIQEIGLHSTPSEFEILISKILTVEQILGDF